MRLSDQLKKKYNTREKMAEFMKGYKKFKRRVLMLRFLKRFFKKESKIKYLVVLIVNGSPLVMGGDWYYETRKDAEDHVERMCKINREKGFNNEYQIFQIYKGLK